MLFHQKLTLLKIRLWLSISEKAAELTGLKAYQNKSSREIHKKKEMNKEVLETSVDRFWPPPLLLAITEHSCVHSFVAKFSRIILFIVVCMPFIFITASLVQELYHCGCLDFPTNTDMFIKTVDMKGHGNSMTVWVLFDQWMKPVVGLFIKKKW